MEIYGLNELPEDLFELAGGKAAGLKKLIAAEVKVAKGFVVIGLEKDDDYEKAAEFYQSFTDKKVAVRSSAGNEDGADFSGAGQYATVLNVGGKEQFIDALKECMASLTSERVSEYAKTFGAAKSGNMSIVVQEMVEAEKAGVTFTVDPVTGEKHVVVEAVEGLGESLVSGKAAAEKRIVKYSSTGIFGIDGGDGILSVKEAAEITRISLNASEKFGEPLDLEWAIDKDGNLLFLQARPVTTQTVITESELDSVVESDNTVYTTCNIGEMLPGAVTPLSLSVTVRSIDAGLRRMLVRAGAYKNLNEVKEGSCVTHFSNHLFFNLTTIFKMATAIVGANQSDVEASICGKSLDTPPLPYKKIAGIVRLKNGIKYFSFLFGRKKAMKKIDRLIEKLKIDDAPTPLQYYKNIDAKTDMLDDSTWYHYNTSAHSGAMSSTLLRFMKESGPEENEARSILAALLEDIDGIESVDILRSMRRIAAAALKADSESKNFSAEKLLAFISNDNGELKSEFDYFIKRHGHRSIREAELRSRSWDDDRILLAENILTVMNSPNITSPSDCAFNAGQRKKPSDAAAENTGYLKARAALLEGKKFAMKKTLGFMLDQARKGVYSREYTKARFVKAVDCFKRAYNKLASMMVRDNIIPDEDLVYFLTHKELGELLTGNNPGLVKTAVRRKRLLPVQQKVRFKDIYFGRPEPLRSVATAAENGTVLSGVPISRGETVGRARVVKSREDAQNLADGEIMVASFTDIGWSPYYAVISGLITEVGSALSHGAVVAREYGLPLVVNVAGATDIIKTGDTISLDATNGTVTVIRAA